MTEEQLCQYRREIDNLKRRLDAAYEAAETMHRIEKNPDASGWPLEVYKNLAKQAADVNEGGELRMWLVGALSEES